jgi:Dolichyl-phosphate-mannose-protein mannosyltransferase
VSTRPKAGGETRPDFLARFLGAVPLLVVYFALAALYAWQASRRPVPTIFTDELELTQLARAIADTGEPARRGVPYDSLATLAAYVLAPVWWLGSATESWATAKLVLVLAMTATIFPAYGLARMVVPKWYALAAATAAVAVPALAYAPILVEEPLAYPVATLALWLIARSLERLTWGRLAAATALCVVGALTRTQLAILVMALALGLLWLAWQSEVSRRWRSTWSDWDWVRAVTLAVGIALALAAAMGHASTAWRNTMLLYKDRIVEHATWALGALAIGMGILPVIAGVSALARPKDEERDPRTHAFVITTVAALVVFIAYAGVKGAYISTVFATQVVERNVIYLSPLLFTATALAFARGIGRGWAIAGAGIFTLVVVARTPLHLDFPYYEAHGFSIATLANRELGMTKELIEGVLVGIVVVAFLAVVALKLVRPRSTAFTAIAASAAVVVLAWGLTGQVYAAEGERDFSEFLDGGLPKPNDWVQEATNGGSVVVLGQQITDATNIWLTEFFNPSVELMWSLDGSAVNVGGPILTPDLDAVDGTLKQVPGTEYVLAVNGVRLQAPIVAERKDAVLYRVGGGPIKLQDALVGRQSDGWMVGTSEDPNVARASYTRYDVSADEPGFASLLLSRVGWCPKRDLRETGHVTVKIGPVGIGPQEPRITHVTDSTEFDVADCKAQGATLTPPPDNVPWRMEITVSPTFRPKDIDPSKSESRYLGAQIKEAGFQPLFG